MVRATGLSKVRRGRDDAAMRFSNGEVVVQSGEFAAIVNSKLRFLEQTGFQISANDVIVLPLSAILTYRGRRPSIVIEFDVRDQWFSVFVTPNWNIESPIQSSHSKKYIGGGVLISKSYRRFRRKVQKEPGIPHRMPDEMYLSSGVLDRLLEELKASLEGPNSSLLIDP